MSRRRKSFASKNIRQIPEGPESIMVTPKGLPPEPPPPPPKRLIKNDREILPMVKQPDFELHGPKTIPILQIGVASLGVSLHMQQDYEGSYQKWRLNWTACGFGFRASGILYPRGDLT